jgi:hypothetical protein
MPKAIDDSPGEIDPDAPADSEQAARQQATKQAKARRLFKISTASAGVGVTLLVPIWATTEYHNADGWPTRGFSQRSGTHGVWNIWIIYPFLAYALITAGHRWFVYGRLGTPIQLYPRGQGSLAEAVVRSCSTRGRDQCRRGDVRGRSG